MKSNLIRDKKKINTQFESFYFGSALYVPLRF